MSDKTQHQDAVEQVYAEQIACFRKVTDTPSAADCQQKRRLATRRLREQKLEKSLVEAQQAPRTISELGITIQAPKDWDIKQGPSATVLSGASGKVAFMELTCESAAPSAMHSFKEKAEAETRVLQDARGWYVKEAKTFPAVVTRFARM